MATASPPPPRAHDVQRAIEIVGKLPPKSRLATFASGVLLSQADAGTTFAGREYVETRARSVGLTREEAETDAGNVMTILERGPSTPLERALLAALAVRGLGARIEAADEADRDAAVTEVLPAVDALENGSPYPLLGFVDGVLSDAHARRFWSALASDTLEQDATLAAREGSPSHAARARLVARVYALAAASPARAGEALASVAREAQDPGLRALATALSGGEPGASPSHAGAGSASSSSAGGRPSAAPGAETGALVGRLAEAPRNRVWAVVSAITGFSVLSALVRLVARVVLGMRTDARVTIVPAGVKLSRTTKLLGRTVREGEETLSLESIAAAERETRFRSAPLYVGVTALCLGGVLGVITLVDGIRASEPSLALVGAGLALLGAAIDLALNVLVPAGRGRVRVALRVLPRRTLWLADVETRAADVFLRDLERRLARR